MKSIDSATVNKRIAISVLSQVGSQIIVALAGVVALKVLTNSLGVKTYGIYVTILAFVTTFALLTDLGLNAITGREIAKNPQKTNEIISYNMGLRIFLCLVMIPAISLLSIAFYPNASSQLRIGILILSFSLFFDAIRSVALAYFTAKIRNDIAAIINSSQQLLLLGTFAVIALMGWGLFGFLCANIIISVLSSVVAFIVVRQHVPIIPRVSLSKWKGIIAMSMSLGIIQVINMMYLKADSIMLSIFKGTTEVGVYGVAYSLIIALLTLPGFIMSALIPSMSTSTQGGIISIVEKAFQYIVILACLLVAGTFLIRYQVVLVVADINFAAAATPFAILGLASAFSYLNNVFGFASVSLNKHHKMVYVSLLSLFLNIGLNFILIPRYSFNGAAWATVVSEFIALIGVYYVFQAESGIHVKLLNISWKPILTSAAVILIIQSSQHLWLTSNNLINLLVTGILILLLFAGILFSLNGIPKEVLDYLKGKVIKITPK